MQNIAIYDLSCCPITFDFAAFLAGARLFFYRATGNTCFDLLIFADKFRSTSPRDKAIDCLEKEWRVHNLLIPIISCSPFVRSYSLLRSRPKSLPDGVLTYPINYSLTQAHGPNYYFGSILRKWYNGKLHPGCFQAPRNALAHANKLFRSSKPTALISPRFTDFEGLRNTKIDQLAGIATRLVEKDFHVGLIHDQDDPGDWQIDLLSIGNITLLPEASFSLPIRLALTEIANVNILTPCGLMAFSQLAKSKPNMVCYDMIKPPNISYTGDKGDYVHRGGMDFQSPFPYPWSTANSIFLWEENYTLDAVVSLALKVAKYPRP